MSPEPAAKAKSSHLFLVEDYLGEERKSLDEILRMPIFRIVDEGHEKLGAFYNLKWNDLMEMDFEHASRVAARHQEILSKGSAELIEKVAHLQAGEVLKNANGNGSSRLDTLNYLKHLVQNNKLNPLVYDEIVAGENEAVDFQRVVRTNTGKYYTKGGMLFEKVKIYPGNYKVREFTSFYSDEKIKKIAEAAQRFYFETAGYVKERLKAAEMTDDGKYLLERIGRLEAINPLNSDKKMVHNILVEGRDMKDELAMENPSVDERVRYMEEITSIDLIMAYFSREFQATDDGRKMYRSPGLMSRLTGKKICNPKDYRVFLAEKIIIPADSVLRERLESSKILDSKGKIHDQKSFKVFYKEGTDIGNVLGLLGINGSHKTEHDFFCVGDFNLGNVMVKNDNGRRDYTIIDFDNAKEDNIASSLFKRWMNSGIFDVGESKVMSNGINAENYLLDSAYKTIEALHRATGQGIMSREIFEEEYKLQKKLYLLNKARRYKTMESKDKNPEKMKDYMGYHFTLFANELLKEGKVKDMGDSRLEYLVKLFGKPLDEKEMVRIKESYDPDFSSHEELSPLVFRDLDKEIDKQIKQYRLQRGLKKAKMAAAVGTGIIALAGLGLLVNNLYNKTQDLNQDKEIAEWMPIFTYLEKNSVGGFQRYQKYTMFNRYEMIFQDRRTAMAACLDLGAVYEAAEHEGMPINYNYIENFKGGSLMQFWIPYDKIEDYLEKNYPKVYWAIEDSSDDVLDSWMRNGAGQIADNKIKKLSMEARQKLEEKKKKQEMYLPMVGYIKDGKAELGPDKPYECSSTMIMELHRRGKLSEGAEKQCFK